MIPKFWDVIGNELVLAWNDGHESYYELEQLRRTCPCASCAGESDLFGHVAKGPEPQYVPESFQITTVEPTGNYGLQIQWGDGHSWGIWTFAQLRESCPCGEHGVSAH